VAALLELWREDINDIMRVGAVSFWFPSVVVIGTTRPLE